MVQTILRNESKRNLDIAEGDRGVSKKLRQLGANSTYTIKRDSKAVCSDYYVTCDNIASKLVLTPDDLAKWPEITIWAEAGPDGREQSLRWKGHPPRTETGNEETSGPHGTVTTALRQGLSHIFPRSSSLSRSSTLTSSANSSSQRGTVESGKPIKGSRSSDLKIDVP